MSPVQSLVADARREIVEIEAAACPDLGDWLVIDVREPAEFATGHVAGAINIPRGLLDFEVDRHLPVESGRHCRIAVYCRSGARAALAAQSLHRLGFTHVRSIAGGIMGWTAAGKPVVLPDSLAS
jgi:rhodanese-related sulfurtransferase